MALLYLIIQHGIANRGSTERKRKVVKSVIVTFRRNPIFALKTMYINRIRTMFEKHKAIRIKIRILIRLMFVKHEAIKIKMNVYFRSVLISNYQISEKIRYKTTIHSISNHYQFYIVFSLLSR